MERPVKITIEAPQGWGKGWLARQMAEWIGAWKGCAVEICDAGGDEPEIVGLLGASIDVKIVTRQPK